MSQELIDKGLDEEIEAAKRELAAAVENLVTEDDEPVDNLLSAKQQRLLVEPLYSSWTPPPAEGASDARRIFLADANVGLFISPYKPPLVPDMFLSLDVKPHKDWHDKQHRSYFFWQFGKPPEVAVEIVSNRKGHELGTKLHDYAQFGIGHYIVYDPFHRLSEQTLYTFKLDGERYKESKIEDLASVGLSLMLWTGEFEMETGEWLRWCDAHGNLIPTGAERARREAERADREAQRADRETQRAEKMAAKLRDMGVDPEAL